MSAGSPSAVQQGGQQTHVFVRALLWPEPHRAGLEHYTQ